MAKSSGGGGRVGRGGFQNVTAADQRRVLDVADSRISSFRDKAIQKFSTNELSSTLNGLKTRNLHVPFGLGSRDSAIANIQRELNRRGAN